MIATRECSKYALIAVTQNTKQLRASISTAVREISVHGARYKH
jgi:hypothetical protein